MVPTTNSRSAWRGVKRGSAAPKRSMSHRGPATEKYSIPQHAVTKGYGKKEYLRAHWTASASRVATKLSGNARLSSETDARVSDPPIRYPSILRRCFIFRKVAPAPGAHRKLQMRAVPQVN